MYSVCVYSFSLCSILNLINPSLAPMLVEGRDFLGNAGELFALLSVSSNPARLPTDTEVCIVDNGENPGIPNTSKD